MSARDAVAERLGREACKNDAADRTDAFTGEEHHRRVPGGGEVRACAMYVLDFALQLYAVEGCS
jgi:hypothetical protein